MAKLIVISGSVRGTEFDLQATQTIGRLEANEIHVTDSRMSRQNTVVFARGTTWWVEDRESKNGTFLNGKRIDTAALTDGDELRVGETLFNFDAQVGTSAPGFSAPSSTAEIREVSDRALSFSKFSGDNATKTSFSWVRQDLAQRDGGFRLLVIVGLILIGIGVFWLTQMSVSQS